jgi:hypothetical protein
MGSHILKDFVDGNFVWNFIHLLRPNREARAAAQNTTMGLLAEIESAESMLRPCHTIAYERNVWEAYENPLTASVYKSTVHLAYI